MFFYSGSDSSTCFTDINRVAVRAFDFVYTVFVRHRLVLVEEPQVSQGPGQDCFSLGGVNILDDEQPLI